MNKKQAIATLEEKLAVVEEMRRVILQQLAELHCPYKVGAVVVPLKDASSRWVVTSITPEPLLDCEFSMNVRRLGKGGKPVGPFHWINGHIAVHDFKEDQGG